MQRLENSDLALFYAWQDRVTNRNHVLEKLFLNTVLHSDIATQTDRIIETKPILEENLPSSSPVKIMAPLSQVDDKARDILHKYVSSRDLQSLVELQEILSSNDREFFNQFGVIIYNTACTLDDIHLHRFYRDLYEP